jgi:ribose transport system substrate-binding protein
MAPAAFAAHGYTIGVSNTVQGNGWREEMICAMRAQAAVEEDVSGLIVAHRNTDSAGQLEDLNNLIEAGVDAIVLNPSNPDALNSALDTAMEQGIVVVAVDAGVTAEGAYILSNNQEEYAYLGARWLFEQLGGEATSSTCAASPASRPIPTVTTASSARWPNSPASNVMHEVFTGWQQDQGKQQMFDFLATGIPFDGVWTSGIDNVIVDAFTESGAPLVPIVGADNAGFVGQYLPSVEGLTGGGRDQSRFRRRRGHRAGSRHPERRSTRQHHWCWWIRSCGKTRRTMGAPPSPQPKTPISIPNGRSR